jgi:hypothetical protein
LLHALRNPKMKLLLSSTTKTERVGKTMVTATLVEANLWEEPIVMVTATGR